MRLRTSLTVAGFTEDPNTLCQKLGVTPSHVYRKGEPNPAGIPWPRNAFDVYLPDAEDSVPDTQIRALLCESDISHDLLRLLAQEHDVVVCCAVFHYDWNEFFRLERDTLSLLHKLHVLLTFDIYCERETVDDSNAK